MARFLVKASEFKNVCKAVNDRKLSELKKEIIEILKKQDEKEVKKAVDYFTSQELHYTHLEKSLNGKWIEKAGYGVGTVRIWKGKKYKKIAPGKWARVFDKEGRGTNIAIGKLIARVNKIDNAEDLLQFVMENKQRFMDEDGRELSILDKVRAAVDTRNEKLSGESSPYVYGVGENVNAAKNEMFSKKDKIKKEEADLHKVSRKLSQIPTTELKQEKARLERAVANKTRSKRDSLNNVIFRESNQEKLDAINKELEKRKGTAKTAEKYDDDKAYKEYQKLLSKENPTYDDDTRIGELVTEHYKHSKKEWIGGQGLKELNAAKNEDEVLSNGKTVKETREQYGIETGKKKESDEEESKTYWIQDFEGNRITSDDAKKKIKDIKDKLEYMDSMKEGRTKDIVVSIDAKKRQLENYRDDLISKLNPEDRKEIESEVKKEPENKKSAEDQLKEHGFKAGDKVSFNGDKWEVAGANLDYEGNFNGVYLTPDRAAGNLKSSNVTVFDVDKIDKAEKESGDVEQKKIDMQMQLLELNKKRQDNNKNIKKLNDKVNELKQKKAEDESRGNSVEKYDKEIKDTQKEIDNLLDDNYSIEKEGTKVAKELNQMEKDGVKKSMFDDFVIDMFIDDKNEDEEELKEGETEYNDYSAEQPEDFNSTSMKVREAMDRIRNQVL